MSAVDAANGEQGLAKRALGLPQILFCIVTGAAPIAAMMFNTPVAVLGAGYAAPAAFIISTVTLLIFSVGYIAMAQRVSAAGGFYSFITHAFGPVVGLGTAGLIASCYLIFVSAVVGITAYFANTSILDWFGVDIPAWVLMFVVIAIVAALSYFHIELTARILGVLLVTEVLGLLVLAFAILVTGGDSGIGLDPVNPAKVFSGDNTALIAGASGIALFGAFWSWVGFEMAPNYAEEAREPKKAMGPAMYGSVIGLGILYTFVTWMFVSGWGQGNTAAAVDSQFAGEFASAFYPLTDRYVGGWMTTVFQLLIITGNFACVFAFFNTASRYLFSMGREGLIPKAFGRTHPQHKSPYVASLVSAGIVAVYVLGFVLYDSSTLGALVKLGTWSPLLGVCGILAIQALVSLAVIKYFLKEARDGFHWWKTLLAPAIGAVAQAYAVYLLLKYRGDLSAAAGVPYIKLLPWIVLAIFLAGVVAALVYRARSPKRYEAIGRFVHEDIAG